MNRFVAKHRKVATAIVAVSTAIVMSGAAYLVPMTAYAALTEAQINSILDLLRSFGADQSVVNNVDASLRGQPTTTASATTGTCSFTRDLTVGVRGNDVTCLQNYLTSTGHYTYSGGATGYFGSVTQTAAAAWQKANSVSPSAGYFGALSRAKYNSLVAGVTTTPSVPGTPAVVPVAGDALGVSKPDQPGDNLAPGNATRIPVTKFTLTAGTKDVTVNSVTVERIGLATDAAVDKVLLLGPDGLQIGLNKTLGSNHRSVLNEALVIKAGEAKTYTVAFNRPAGNEAGNVLSFDVVAIDATSPLTGTLPIRGSQITMNTTLTIGSVDLARGVNDPGASATSSTKSIGDTAYKFAALRLTAGAAEDLTIKSVAWYQAGSVGSGDLANVKVILGDIEYPTVVSSDGKYYTAKFSDGITLAKGNQIEMYIKGDIVGGTSRTVAFDLFRDTDVDVRGKNFGFGVKPGGGTATAGSTAFGALSSDTEPAYRGFVAQVGAGTITVSKSTHTSGAAQNVAVNLNDQPIGAFDVDVKGEAITASSIVFRVSGSRSGGTVTEADFTNVSLYDSTGKIVAGPKDGSGTTDAEALITFTDAVEFPVGKGTYVLKGKLSTDFANNDQVSASTTPNSNWTSLVGRVSGITLTAANVGVVTGNSMTVKTAALSVSLGNTPTAQTLIRGTTGFTFANVVFDSTASGEDIRVTSAQVQLMGADGNEVKNCNLYDGTTALTSGSNTVNPTGEGDQTFTFDSAIIITKGTSKTLALKCDTLASGDAGQSMWTFSSNETFGATGMTSGNTLTVAVASSTVTNIITFSGSGTLTVALDSSSPALRLAQAGQVVPLAVLRFTATNEEMDVKQVALRFNNVASNTPADLVNLTLWDGATKVGTITATSSNVGLITSVSGFVVPKDSDKLMTIKGELAPIGISQAGRPGHRVTVDYDSVNLDSNSPTYAVGLGSSQIIRVTSNDTASAGVIVVRGYPTISVLSVPSASLSDASAKVLYRFSVAAPSGTNGVSLFKTTFSVATSGDESSQTSPDFTITNLRLYCFTSSGFSGGCYSSDGQLNNGATFFSTEGGNDLVENDRATSTDRAIYFNPANPSSTGQGNREAIAIPAGSTYYFELRGDVLGADSGDTATIQLMGDDNWLNVASSTSPNSNRIPYELLSDGVRGDDIGLYTDIGFTSGDANRYSFATTALALDDSVAEWLWGTNVGATGNNSDDNAAGDDFIWSGNSTTTHSGSGGGIMGPDWYNGFAVPGLPAAGAQAVSFTL